MTSIRNAPIEIASARVLHYLRTHNYNDCAIYINRLHSHTFRQMIMTELSFDILLSQLPFSIEIFEVIYSKIFITDPETFPIQILKPERLISKMISIFSLPSSFSSSNASSTLEKSPSSTSLGSKDKEYYIDDERVLSNLASILRVVSYVQPILFKRLLRQKETIDECILYFEQRHTTVPTISSLKKSTSLTNLNLEDTIRQELESTILCCQQALHKLSTKTNTVPMPPDLSSTHSTPAMARKRSSIYKSPSTFSSMTTTTTTTTSNSLDEIQKRLYQHKSVLNLIEPYLSRTKLYTTINNLTNKVSIDKQILLAYAHIKIHEKQIPLHEPLLPLFKRFAFAYERRSISLCFVPSIFQSF